MNQRNIMFNWQLAPLPQAGPLWHLIPPSIMLIVMGPVLEVSTLTFSRAFFHGALLQACIASITSLLFNPQLGPILSDEDQPETPKSYGAEVALVSLGILTLCRILAWVLVKILCLPALR